jgi:hypothetical protein
MIKDPRMNARWLRAFLSEKEVRKLKVKWDLSDKALLFLAVDIFVRAHYHRNPPPLHPYAEAYAGATETRYYAEWLLERLEKLHSAGIPALAVWHGLPDDDPSKPAWIESCNEHISRLAAAIAALAAVVPHLKSSGLWPPRRATWRDHAVALAQHFVDRIRECNPGHQIGVSDDGPVTSFVRAVIPLITEETPTQGDVYGFLNEHRAEILAVRGGTQGPTVADLPQG